VQQHVLIVPELMMSLKIDQHFAELLQQFNGSVLVVAVFLFHHVAVCVCVNLPSAL